MNEPVEQISIQSRLNELRTNLDSIRKSGKIAYWRLSYAENLFARAGEYVLVGREPEALETCSRLDKWLARHLPKISEKPREMPPIVAFNAEYLKNVLASIRETLDKKRPLIPVPERESALRHLDMLGKMLERGELRRLHDETLALRGSLIARLKRSYRARSALLPLKNAFKQTSALPPSAMIGLYNSQKTLENAFDLIGERDPIWVEDFLEVYSELFRYVETLSPEKKTKKPAKN